jgi:hypothetical protein
MIEGEIGSIGMYSEQVPAVDYASGYLLFAFPALYFRYLIFASYCDNSPVDFIHVEIA